MKKKEQFGTVVSVEGEKAVVQLKVDAGCSLPLACSCCSGLRPGPVLLRVHRRGLEEGDSVHVCMPAYAGYVSAFFTFVLPLIMVVLGLVVGSRLEEPPGTHDLPTLAGGLVGFLTAVLIAAGVQRWLTGATRCEVQRVKAVQTSDTGQA